MSLLRFLGIGGRDAGREATPQSLIELEQELESLPAEEARFIAAFVYLLARIAGADLRSEQVERQEIARHAEEFGGISSARAELLASSAVRIADAHSASDDHLVARAFRDMSEETERIRLLRCLYAVAAADDSISTREDNEIFEVGSAIGVAREEIVALRSEFRDYLAALKPLPSEGAGR